MINNFSNYNVLPFPGDTATPGQTYPKTIDEIFDWLLSPCTEQQFNEKIWEKKPYIISRRSPDYYDHFFKGTDFSNILESTRFGPTDIRLAANGQQPPFNDFVRPGGRLDAGRIAEFYLNGYSVILHSLENFNDAIAEFAQSLRKFFSAKVNVNAYFTPRGAQALKAHYDNHDVFIMQIEGSKNWQLYHSAMNCPLLGSMQPNFSAEQLPEPKKIRLEKGDCMYIPRGWVHDAAATEESSLHLTIGIHPVQWVDFMTKALAALSYAHQSLRKALPVGFLRNSNSIDQLQKEFRQLVEVMQQQGCVENAYKIVQNEFMQEDNMLKVDSLIQLLDNLSAINLDTIVKKRLYASSAVTRLADKVTISFNNASVEAPSHYLDAFMFISDIERDFLVTEIPGLADSKKISLVQRLVRDGLLTYKTGC